MEIDGILKIILAALVAAFFASIIPRKLKERENSLKPLPTLGMLFYQK
jgi:hypothetical protein